MVYKKLVKEAKLLGFQDDELVAIYKDQLKDGAEFGSLKQVIQEEFFAYNIAQLVKNWYAFYWVNAKGNKRLTIEPLLNGGVEILKRDLKIQLPLTHQEYLESRMDVVDKNTLENWRHTLFVQRDLLLNKYLNVATALTKENTTLVITTHAYQRWKQRICSSSEPFNKYNPEERKQFYDEIFLAFFQATRVYQIEDNEFYLSKDRFICFVVKRNVVVTLYIHDFGFNSEINKIIARQQFKYIKHLAVEVKKNQSKREKAKKLLDDQIQVYESKINQAQNELVKLQEEQKHLATQKMAVEELMRQEQETLVLEEKKLFKKWTPVVEDDLNQNDEDTE